MQLLDRLGYGLVSLPPSLADAEEKTEGGFDNNAQKNEGLAGEKSYSAPVSGMDPPAAGTPQKNDFHV